MFTPFLVDRSIPLRVQRARTSSKVREMEAVEQFRGVPLSQEVKILVTTRFVRESSSDEQPPRPAVLFNSGKRRPARQGEGVAI